MLRNSTFASVIVLCCISYGHAQEATEVKPSAASVADVNGTWKWEREFNGNKIEFVLKLKQDQGKISGSYQAIFGADAPAELSAANEIKEAKLDGNQLSFAVVRQFNGNDFRIDYSGTVDGSTIKGTQTRDGRNGRTESEWVAQKSSSLSDVVGKWNISFESINGDKINSAFTLSEDGGKLKGKYHSQFFGENDIKNIEYKDGKLTFEVVFENDQGSVALKYNAEAKGENLTGTIKSSFGGQDNETKFEGKRESERKVEKAAEQEKE
ncbi:MAG: hypothetical protein KDB03_00685 [Planctomycetales bacterium]|nr:hypothetical protein [Planctomycetales bacterium]